jgi:MoaA/NifB/PqqE/SkfB family radical SAM enzyme
MTDSVVNPTANHATACDLQSLRFVSLRLLWDCNIRCVMCDHPYRPKSEMPVETAHAVLDQLSRPVRLTFIGGEPCLWLLKYPGVFTRALDEGHLVHVITNGILVPRLTVLVEAFRDRAVSVQFSADGVGAGYEAVRQGASWLGFVESVRLLQRQRISSGNRNAYLAANYVLLRQTLPDLPRFIRFCSDEGIDTAFVTYGLMYESMLERGTVAPTDSVHYCRQEVADVLAEASELAERLGLPLGLPPALDDSEAFGRRFVGKPKVSLPPGRSSVPVTARSLACDKPWKEIFVNQDGAIVPCCCGPGTGPAIGNIADGLAAVWSGPAAAAVRGALMEGSFDSACRCGVNISAVGRKESLSRFFVTKIGPAAGTSQ